jgi:hypothetical protein
MPTSRPTFGPSNRPTSSPTFVPTVTPTITPYQGFDAAIYQSKWNPLLPSDQPVFTAYVNNQLDYTAQITNKWSAFVSNSLDSPFNLTHPMIELRVTGIDSGDLSAYHLNVNCSITKANNAMHAGLTSTSANAFTSINCGSLPVFVRRQTLCWNCSRANACMSPRNGRFSLPGSTSCLTTEFPKFALAIIFHQSDQTLESVPKLASLNITASSTSLLVNAVMEASPTGGLIYCHPFYNYSVSTISRSLIKSVGTIGVIKGTQEQLVSITLSNLAPLTAYTVYCHVTDSVGNGFDLKTVLQYRKDVKTTCCRALTFSSPPQDTAVGSSIQVSFRLSSFPDHGLLVVRPVIYHLGVSAAETVDIYPSSFNFSSSDDIRSLARNIQIFVHEDAPTGDYQLHLLVSGSASLNYSNANNSFQIIRSDSPLPPVNLSTAVFSNGGGSVKVCFNGPTDYAKTILETWNSVWQCSRIFNFTGDSYSSCVWVTNACVTITFCGSNLCTGVSQRSLISLLKPGDSIGLIPKTIKTACTAGEVDCIPDTSPLGSGRTCATKCDKSQYSPIQSIVSEPPPNAIQPEVYLSVISPSGLCESNLIIDATATTGNAGRDWLFVSWTVIDSTGQHDQPLERLLGQFSLTKPISVPTNTSSTKLSITLQVTNFLLSTSLASIEVNLLDSPLHVAFHGPTFRRVFSYDAFLASVQVTLPSCNDTTVSSGVTYNWKVYNGTQYFPLSSTTSDQSRMQLDAYTLNSGDTYFFYVTVETARNASASALLEVLVAPGSVFVMIKGADSMTIPYDSPLTLDASLSVQEDLPPKQNSVDLTWSCQVTSVSGISSPTQYGDNCDNLFDLSTMQANSLDLVPIRTSQMSPGVQYSFTASASSLSATTGNSVQSATVVVERLLDGLSSPPNVVLYSSFKKFLSTKIVQIRGAITNSVGEISYSWSLTDEDKNNILLEPISLTQLISSATEPNTSSLDLSLSLKPNSLLGGKVYTFRLTAYSSTDPLLTASGSLTVSSNGPPSGGQLLISPSEGWSLQTIFSWAAPLWIDEDLPLLYSFSYSLFPTGNSSTAPSVGLGFATQQIYLQTMLPPGYLSESSSIYGSVTVADFYGAQTQGANNVTVWRVSSDSSPLLSTVNSSITNAIASSDFSSAFQFINLASTSLIVSDCSMAPDCASLNRESCFSTPATCGSCLEGFVGVSGDSNQACTLNQTQLTLTSSLSLMCSSHSDCFPQSCIDSQCVDMPKECPSSTTNECSGRGSCDYFDINTGKPLSTACYSSNPYCFARCRCYGDFFGASCNFDAETFFNRSQARELLCSGLVSIGNSSSPSPELISLLSSSLSLVFNPHEAISVNGQELMSCLSVVELLARYASQLQNEELWSSEVVSTQQNLLDVISKFLQYLQILDVARTEFGSVVSTIDHQLNNMLEGLFTSINSQMGVGEIGYSLVSDGIRMIVNYSRIDSLDGAVLQTPLTEFDSKLGAMSASLVLPPTGLRACGNGAGDYVRLSVLEWGRSPYLNIQNPDDTSFISRIFRFSTIGNVADPPMDSTTAYDTTYELWMYFTSPQSNTTLPNCTFISGDSSIAHSSCRVLSYNSTWVQYNCSNLLDLCPNSGENRRLLLTDSEPGDNFHPLYQHNQRSRRLDFNYEGEGDDDDGASSKIGEYGTLPGSIGREAKKILASPELFNPKKAIPILSSLSGVLFLLFIALALFSKWDHHDYVTIRYLKSIRPVQHHSHPSSQLDQAFSSGSLSFREMMTKDESIRSLGEQQSDPQLSFNASIQRSFTVGEIPDQSLSRDPTASSIVFSMNQAKSWFGLSSGSGLKEKIGDTVSTFFDHALPPTSLLDTKNGWLRFIRAVIREHDWIRMFTYPSLREPRTIRLIIVCTDILLLLFLDSLFYGLYYKDDGTCESLSAKYGFTINDCLREPSPIQGVSKCQWQETDEICSLRPPPATITFFIFVTMIVTVLTVIPSIVLHTLLTDVCPRRPQFRFWSTEEDDEFMSPTITRKSELGHFLKDIDAKSDHSARQVERYAYMEQLTVEEEANLILAAAEATMAASLKTNPLPWRVDTLTSHKNYAINHAMELLGVYPDGSPVPLNWYQWLIFHTPRRRLEGKIRNVRSRTEPILEDLKMFVEGEEDCKDTLLIRNFILEQVSPFHRYALRREFFSVDDAIPGFVDGRIWLMAWGTVIACWLFFIYWILQWAAVYSGITLEAWCYQIVFVFVQEIFFNELIQIFLVHVVVLEALRPQLRQIYYALNTVVLSKMINVSETDRIQSDKTYFRITQHLSPACRAARRPQCDNLPSAQILKRIDDNDAAICMSNRTLNLGLIMSALIIIPTLLALSHETIQEGVMEILLPTVYCCFILANAYLLGISPYLLAAPYVAVGLALLYRYAYLLPSRHRKLQGLSHANEIAVTGTEEHQTGKGISTEDVEISWRNMNLSIALTSPPLPSARVRFVEDLDTFPGGAGGDLHGLDLPESIQNMRIRPARFRHFKHHEKYRKKVATHYLNKHLWNSESKVPEAPSALATEVANVEQFLTEDQAHRAERAAGRKASSRRGQLTSPGQGRGQHSLRPVREGDESPSPASAASSSPRQLSSSRSQKKVNRKLTARFAWQAKEEEHRLHAQETDGTTSGRGVARTQSK